VEVREGTTAEVRILAETRNYTIEGTVMDESGAPVGGLSVSAQILDGSGIGAIGETLQDGSFRIEHLTMGSYNVRVWKLGYEMTTQENVPAGTKGLQIVLKK